MGTGKFALGIFFATNWAPESFLQQIGPRNRFLPKIGLRNHFCDKLSLQSLLRQIVPRNIFCKLVPGKIGRRQNEPWLIGPRQIIGSRMFNIESKCTNTLINTYHKCCNSILAVYIQCKCIHWVQGLGKCI